MTEEHTELIDLIPQEYCFAQEENLEQRLRAFASVATLTQISEPET